MNPDGAREIAAAVRERRLTAVAAAEAALARIEALNGRLNAYRVVTRDRALAEAAAVDAALSEGRDPGLLAGVPYGVKDLFDVAGLPTVAGSKIGLERPPASADAVLVARLKAAGAVLLGVQVMDEYAYGFTTENAHHGSVRNPLDLERSAGGSSGGSAAATAASAWGPAMSWNQPSSTAALGVAPDRPIRCSTGSAGRAAQAGSPASWPCSTS